MTAGDEASRGSSVDPTLAQIFGRLSDAGHWVTAWDDQWRYVVDELEPSDDAAALDLDPNAVSYIQLADLDTATAKARRDAPTIAVCDIATAGS